MEVKEIIFISHLIICVSCILFYVMLILRCKRLGLHESYKLANTLLDIFISVLPLINIFVLMFYIYEGVIVKDSDLYRTFKLGKGKK